jgi:hypothetical protein
VLAAEPSTMMGCNEQMKKIHGRAAQHSSRQVMTLLVIQEDKT